MWGGLKPALLNCVAARRDGEVEVARLFYIRLIPLFQTSEFLQNSEVLGKQNQPGLGCTISLFAVSAFHP